MKISAKSLSKEESSDAIIVSFESKWLEALKEKSFSAVIRKRIAKSLVPKWLYFHINSPVSAICARAKINNHSEIPVTNALALTEALDLGRKEIESYCAGSDLIGLYQIGNIEVAAKPASVAEIREKLNYYPPQSFLVMSREAKRIIDDISKFKRS